MAISLYAGALRYLGLSQAEAAELHARNGKPASLATIKDWSSGRRGAWPSADAWEDLRRFAQARARLIEERCSISIEDARHAADTLTEAPSAFPTTDSYVTMLAAAALAQAPQGQ